MAHTSPSFEIGILLSQKGRMARHECAHLQGTLLGIAAINEAGGVLGHQLMPRICDPASNFVETPALIERMIRHYRIMHIFGCSDSTVRKRVMPIVERYDATLWYPTQFEGFEYSPNIVYGGACPNQLVVPLFEYLISCGHQTFLLVGNDFVFPRQTNHVMRRLIATAGGSIAGEHYVPFNAGSGEIEAALGRCETKVDVVFSTVVSPASAQVLGHLRRRGVKARMASVTASELDLIDEPDLFNGHICALPYFASSGDRPNEMFLRVFRKRFGDKARPNWHAVSSFMQVQLFAQTAERAGSFDVEAIRRSIGLDEVEGPLGRCGIDGQTNYLTCRPRVGISNGRGDFDIAYEAPENVRPDPYFISYA